MFFTLTRNMNSSSVRSPTSNAMYWPGPVFRSTLRQTGLPKFVFTVPMSS
ncbi:MAG: hypothetical protein IPO60_11140 [Flavobacteriales bacterium]|nr:hypothetical protein [Flavobacteriales bacterium]